MNSIEFANLNINFLIRLLLISLIIVLISIPIFPILSHANEDLDFAEDNHSRVSMDIDGNIYMRENIDKRIFPASMTKIAISIVAIENLDLDEEILIQESEFKITDDYVLTPLYIGEKVTVRDLLYANLLKSGNDASVQLARHIYGDKDEFINGINKYLKKIGLNNTNFTNPYGLHEESHYTTAYDILLLAKYSMQNRIFRDIVNTEKYIIPENDFSNARTMYNTSLFNTKDSSLYDKNFQGVKTGFTEEAGDCFVTSAMINDKEFYFIYTGADSRIEKFVKIKEMYDETIYIFEKKDFVKAYNKEIEKENNLLLNMSHINSSLFFSTFDKAIIILFSILVLYLIFSRIKKPKKKKKRKKRK